MPLIDLNGLGHFKDKENAMVANDYSASSTYAVGDYVFYNGTLFRCKTAITTAEAWTAGHWEAAVLTDAVSELNTNYTELKSAVTMLGVTIGNIDISRYDVVYGTIQSNGKWSAITSGSAYRSALITDIPKEMTVTAKASYNSYVSFLSEVISQPTSTTDVIPFCYGETGRHTITAGTTQELNVPSDCKCIVVTVLSNGLDYTPSIYAVFEEVNLPKLGETVSKIANPSNVFEDENRNLCLAGIKTDITTDKIPYHRGFLFHKLQNNDKSLWYGTDFNHLYKIGTVSFNPTLMRFAISPKDGRIIAVQRDTRNGIWVWDGSTETHLNSFATNPMAWLYNSGVDFIVDSNNVEHCVFAEYTSSPSSDLTLNVWRGTYPYTSATDWEIVLSQTSGDVNIGHFHQIRRDPWSNVLYCTSGDSDASSKWWYSTDYGATWTLLVSGSETGWGDSLCRTINFIFTEDYVYWATDHAESEHTLNKIGRDSVTGVIDLTTKAKITDLPNLYATNSLCYCETPHGLFMYDRIDTTSSSIFGTDVTMKFWSFDSNSLVDIVTLGLTENSWGGSRGKCYINYTNGKQTMPAMGFSIDTPCIFDLVCDDPSNIGTIAYDVGSKTIHTIDY